MLRYLMGRTRHNHKEPKAADSLALADASTVHGAGRHLFKYHDNPTWGYAAQYNASEDRYLYFEFLHNILLYDQIFMDNGCTRRDESPYSEVVYEEIESMVAAVNGAAGECILRREAIAPDVPFLNVLDTVCRALKSGCASHHQRKVISSIRIPWYYATEEHIDYRACARAAERCGLDMQLVPLALYVYRGICYSGWANGYKNINGVPTAYLASPGRLRALEPILSKAAMSQLEYPHSAYSDLVSLLDLPPSGYDFSTLQLEPAHTSQLALALQTSEPREALNFTLKLRQSEKGRRIREAWRSRIWAATHSCAVGATTTSGPTNIAFGNVVNGNFTQIIYAAAD